MSFLLYFVFAIYSLFGHRIALSVMLLALRLAGTGTSNLRLQRENRVIRLHILVHTIPDLRQGIGCLPCQLGITQPKANEMASAKC